MSFLHQPAPSRTERFGRSVVSPTSLLPGGALSRDPEAHAHAQSGRCRGVQAISKARWRRPLVPLRLGRCSSTRLSRRVREGRYVIPASQGPSDRSWDGRRTNDGGGWLIRTSSRRRRTLDDKEQHMTSISRQELAELLTESGQAHQKHTKGQMVRPGVGRLVRTLPADEAGREAGTQGHAQ